MDTVPLAADKAGELTERFAPQLLCASMPTMVSCRMLRLARQRKDGFTHHFGYDTLYGVQ
jgi:hypothetical protein